MHPGSELHFGLIGYPLGHSLSPQIHQAALQACGLAGDYLCFPIPSLPQGEMELEGLLARLRQGQLHGLNVTIPHKQSVLKLVDELTPAARSIGAVNLLLIRAGRLSGDNSDAAGFLADLNYSLARPAHSGQRALVLGAGGSARAVVYALCQAGWQVTIAARRVEQARSLADDFQSLVLHHKDIGILPDPQDNNLSIAAIGLELHALAQLTDINLIVNTTPLGMSPHIAASPWPAGLHFPPGAAVYDLVYNPAETALVRAARQSGLVAVTGLGMLIEQAALSFERWTGLPAPRAQMQRAVEIIHHTNREVS